MQEEDDEWGDEFMGFYMCPACGNTYDDYSEMAGHHCAEAEVNAPGGDA